MVGVTYIKSWEKYAEGVNPLHVESGIFSAHQVNPIADDALAPHLK